MPHTGEGEEPARALPAGLAEPAGAASAGWVHVQVVQRVRVKMGVEMRPGHRGWFQPPSILFSALTEAPPGASNSE